MILATWLIALAGCGGHRTGPVVAGARPAQVTRSEAALPPLTEAARQLIRRGRMEIEVEELPRARTRLESALGALGGRVASLEVKEDDRAEYSLRVPADRLDALMDSVAALGRVETRTISAADVTEQVVDTEARLAALRSSRDRLRQLLARANTVQDVVAVERELARVQGELDSLEGRLNALRGQVALSELSVRLDRRRVLGPLGLLLQGVGTLLERLFVWR